MAMIIVLDTTFLRCLSKSVIRKCYGCKKFRSLPYHSPKPEPLRRDRNKKCFHSKVIGTDYAGPIYYKIKRKGKLKVYILLFSLSVNRSVRKELAPNLTTAEFKKSFKRLTSRRGKSKIFYSDNAKTFKEKIKVIRKHKDKKHHDFLSSEMIIWTFNVSKVPWWGTPFERLSRLIKASFYKTIGKAHVTWAELEEVSRDVEKLT